MPNIFLLDYFTRLKLWAELRTKLQDLPIKEQCVEIDRFWQDVPVVNHYLHADYMKDWPDPWQLLSDNTYCYYGRALGMIYTLLLLGNKDIELLDAIDDNSNSVVLVSVDSAKYLLNYWPDTVLNIRVMDFDIKKTYDINTLHKKTGLS
jgi:hypothetical protein